MNIDERERVYWPSNSHGNTIICNEIQQMATGVGNHPSQLATTNNIKKLDFNTDRERTGKQQNKVQVHMLRQQWVPLATRCSQLGSIRPVWCFYNFSLELCNQLHGLASCCRILDWRKHLLELASVQLLLQLKQQPTSFLVNIHTGVSPSCIVSCN